MLFWRDGFRACSINDIVLATGVNRFSLYQEFENKEMMLYNALKLYRERYCGDKHAILKEDALPELVLSKFYLSFFKAANKNQGCFIIHVGTELADTDQNIRSLLKDYLNETEDLFRELLKKHEKTKEFADLYARHLIGLFCTSMSFCLIHSEKERNHHISNGIRIILNRESSYATNTK